MRGDGIVEIQLDFSLPYYKRNSKALMSLNVFRNCHHRVAHKFKVDYEKIIQTELNKSDAIGLGSISLEYHIYFKPTLSGKARHVDLMNVGSVIDKVTSDEIVKYGLIKDDDVGYITDVRFFAHPYSEREYCEIRIKYEDK